MKRTRHVAFLEKVKCSVLSPKSFFNGTRHFIFILLVTSSVLSALSLNAQVTINGNVTDAKGAAVPGANVFIKDSYDGATSDVKGNFSFTTAESGEKIIAASLIG